MTKIYFYKLIVDDGGARCVENGLLSLAICKPMIRRTAKNGDVVIGFAANSLHADNRLIYVARVNEKLENGATTSQANTTVARIAFTSGRVIASRNGSGRSIMAFCGIWFMTLANIRIIRARTRCYLGTFAISAHRGLMLTRKRFRPWGRPWRRLAGGTVCIMTRSCWTNWRGLPRGVALWIALAFRASRRVSRAAG